MDRAQHDALWTERFQAAGNLGALAVMRGEASPDNPADHRADRLCDARQGDRLSVRARAERRAMRRML